MLVNRIAPVHLLYSLHPIFITTTQQSRVYVYSVSNNQLLCSLLVAVPLIANSSLVLPFLFLSSSWWRRSSQWYRNFPTTASVSNHAVPVVVVSQFERVHRSLPIELLPETTTRNRTSQRIPPADHPRCWRLLLHRKTKARKAALRRLDCEVRRFVRMGAAPIEVLRRRRVRILFFCPM